MKCFAVSLALALAGLLVPAGAFVSPDALWAADRGRAEGAENKLIGTWKLVSAKYGGQAVDLAQLGTTLKHVTPAQFMWLSYDADTGRVTRTAGGTYTINGETYEETPRYGLGEDAAAIRGQAQTFTWKIEGEKWLHHGKLSNGLEIDEVWERVKPQ